jgi:UDP-glucose 4-epimerase
MSGRKVLLTGGAGFIGCYLAKRLAEAGDSVVLFDIREPGPEASWLISENTANLTFLQGRIENAEMVLDACRDHGITDIVHMASIVNPVYLSQHPDQALAVNTGGTLNVLEAVRQLGLRRLVYFSSIGVLPRVQYEPIDNKHPLLIGTEGPGASFYGAAKVASEAFCFAYRQSFGIDFITIRPSAVYGFGMQYPLFVKPMIEDSLQGKPVRFDHGREFPRDYTHADDVAQLAQRALDVPAEAVRDRVFYGATGQPLVTAGQVADLATELIPGADIEILPGLSDADRLEISYRGILDIAPAQEQLGYEPRFAHIRAGLVDYIETYRQYMEEGNK